MIIEDSKGESKKATADLARGGRSLKRKAMKAGDEESSSLIHLAAGMLASWITCRPPSLGQTWWLTDLKYLFYDVVYYADIVLTRMS